MCMQNVEHVRKFSNPFLWMLDLLTLKILTLFRLGPWYCYQCEQKSFRLKRKRRRVPTYRSDTSLVDFGDEKVLKTTDNAQSVGNYLKNDQSLVMREKRTHRFSEKFRDSTVTRILSGATTIAQVHHELNVTEHDLISWIANFALRRNEGIEELADELGTLRPDLPEKFRDALRLANSKELNADNIVEGRVLPK